MTRKNKKEYSTDESECAPVRPYLPTVTNSMKWWLAIFLGILFFIFAFGGTYNLTGTVFNSVGFPSYLVSSGCPSIWGVLVHAMLFILVIRLILW